MVFSLIDEVIILLEICVDEMLAACTKRDIHDDVKQKFINDFSRKDLKEAKHMDINYQR